MATQSAAQRRREEALAYQEFVRDCPTSKLLDRIGDKWVTLLLVALSAGPLRYGGLSRALPGASPKMLTQTLRALERDGLLARTVTPSVPIRVDYELTPLGRSLLPVVRAIKDWAELHMGDVTSARDGYDEAGARREAAGSRDSHGAGQLAHVG
jgi:DNA-binding HxlR family transcriptional regulator